MGLELLVLLVVGLIVLGPERMPGVLRSVGKLIGELRSLSDGVVRELTQPVTGKPAFPTYRPKIDRVAAPSEQKNRAEPSQQSSDAPRETREAPGNTSFQDTK